MGKKFQIFSVAFVGVAAILFVYLAILIGGMLQVCNYRVEAIKHKFEVLTSKNKNNIHYHRKQSDKFTEQADKLEMLIRKIDIFYEKEK